MVRIYGVDNHKADVASRLTHLTISEFTIPFNYYFPQQDPRNLHIITCAAKHCMLKILQTKQLPWGCLLPPSGKTPPPGINGKHSETGCACQKKSQESSTPFHYSIFFRRVTDRSPRRQWTLHSKINHGAINQLHGENICSSGYH